MNLWDKQKSAVETALRDEKNRRAQAAVGQTLSKVVVVRGVITRRAFPVLAVEA
ncbi:hypothetical protein [uncultured Methylibium sp.]|uniref:hypothetical protein n=1 Tax=uncultured Methylibium sp. TaxID=381093 RepID=UPI0025D1606A|nr:hypothetical protein [uncultured Methylibium sp.]